MNNKIIYKASLIAIIGNAILALLKVVSGFIADSLAVVGDGLDTTGDILSSLITLYASKIILTPPNKKHPYGYHKADAIASKVLSFIVFFAGFQLLIATIKDIVLHTEKQVPSMLAVYVTSASIAGKLLLTLILFKMGKQANSSMILANAKNMQGDIVISASVLVGLIFTFVLKLPILDTIAALLVSLWILWVGIKIFKETTPELMDGVVDTKIYDDVFKAVNAVEGAYRPHRTRIRKIGSMHAIVLDIEVEATLTVLEAHNIAKNVEECIKQCVENVYDIVVHVEPFGYHHEEESFGVSEYTYQNKNRT